MTVLSMSLKLYCLVHTRERDRQKYQMEDDKREGLPRHTQAARAGRAIQAIRLDRRQLDHREELTAALLLGSTGPAAPRSGSGCPARPGSTPSSPGRGSRHIVVSPGAAPSRSGCTRTAAAAAPRARGAADAAEPQAQAGEAEGAGGPRCGDRCVPGRPGQLWATEEHAAAGRRGEGSLLCDAGGA